MLRDTDTVRGKQDEEKCRGAGRRIGRRPAWSEMVDIGVQGRADQDPVWFAEQESRPWLECASPCTKSSWRISLSHPLDVFPGSVHWLDLEGSDAADALGIVLAYGNGRVATRIRRHSWQTTSSLGIQFTLDGLRSCDSGRRAAVTACDGMQLQLVSADKLHAETCSSLTRTNNVHHCAAWWHYELSEQACWELAAILDEDTIAPDRCFAIDSASCGLTPFAVPSRSQTGTTDQLEGWPASNYMNLVTVLACRSGSETRRGVGRGSKVAGLGAIAEAQPATCPTVDLQCLRPPVTTESRVRPVVDLVSG
nr:hypothetical protein CFP56_24628 [Quercus suber]